MAGFGHKANPTPPHPPVKNYYCDANTQPPTHKKQNILLADINQVTLNCFPLATDWTVWGSNPGGCKILSVLCARPDLTRGAPGDMSWGFFPGRGVYHPRPSCAKFTNEWRYTLTPSLCILWHVLGWPLTLPKRKEWSSSNYIILWHF